MPPSGQPFNTQISLYHQRRQSAFTISRFVKLFTNSKKSVPIIINCIYLLAHFLCNQYLTPLAASSPQWHLRPTSAHGTSWMLDPLCSWLNRSYFKRMEGKWRERRHKGPEGKRKKKRKVNRTHLYTYCFLRKWKTRKRRNKNKSYYLVNNIQDTLIF